MAWIFLAENAWLKPFKYPFFFSLPLFANTIVMYVYTRGGPIPKTFEQHVYCSIILNFFINSNTAQ